MADANERARRRLDDLASRMEPRLARAFREALRQYRESPIWRDVADALASGNTPEALRLIGASDFGQYAEDLRRGIQEAVTAGGDFGAAAVAEAARRIGREALRYDVQNPRTVEFIRSYSLSLIREISENTREGIREAILEGQNRGENPITTARRLRGNIGLTARQRAAVANYRRLLEERNPEALDRALRDRRFDPTIRRAIDQGQPLTQTQINRMVTRYEERSLKRRSETIARTEAIRAVGYGNREAWRQNQEPGAPLAGLRLRRFWVSARDERVRGSHAAAPAINADGVGFDEPFVMGSGVRLMMPRDFRAPGSETVNCRCVEVHRLDE